MLYCAGAATLGAIYVEPHGLDLSILGSVGSCVPCGVFGMVLIPHSSPLSLQATLAWLARCERRVTCSSCRRALVARDYPLGSWAQIVAAAVKQLHSAVISVRRQGISGSLIFPSMKTAPMVKNLESRSKSKFGWVETRNYLRTVTLPPTLAL